MGKALRNFYQQVVSDRSIVYLHYYRMFHQICLCQFKWSGLDDGKYYISSRFTEEELFHKGLCVFHDTKHGYQISRATPIGINAYNEPISFHVSDNSGYSEIIKSKDCVPLYNNYAHTPTFPDVQFFCERLAKIEKTMDANLSGCKTPTLIRCSEGQKTTMQKTVADMDADVPYLFLTEDFDMDAFQLLDLKSKYLVSELQDNKHEIMNDCLTFLSVNNVNVVKKERVNVQESSSNNDLILLNGESRLASRQKFCEEVKEKFNYDISVELVQREIGELNVDKEDGVKNE